MSRRSTRLEKKPSKSYREKRVAPLPKQNRSSNASRAEQLTAKALAGIPIHDGWKQGHVDPKNEIVGKQVYVFWPQDDGALGYHHGVVIKHAISDGIDSSIIQKGEHYHTVYYTDPKWKHQTELVKTQDLGYARNYFIKEDESDTSENSIMYKCVWVERYPHGRKKIVKKALREAKTDEEKKEAREKLFTAFVIRRLNEKEESQDPNHANYEIIYLLDYFVLPAKLSSTDIIYN